MKNNDPIGIVLAIGLIVLIIINFILMNKFEEASNNYRDISYKLYVEKHKETR